MDGAGIRACPGRGQNQPGPRPSGWLRRSPGRQGLGHLDWHQAQAQRAKHLGPLQRPQVSTLLSMAPEGALGRVLLLFKPTSSWSTGLRFL